MCTTELDWALKEKDRGIRSRWTERERVRLGEVSPPQTPQARGLSDVRVPTREGKGGREGRRADGVLQGHPEPTYEDSTVARDFL